MAKFTAGNTAHLARKNPGRKRKMARPLADLVTPEQMEQFMLRAFADGAKGDPAARAWVLAQCPRRGDGITLPAGLPVLNSFASYMTAIDMIGEEARAGRMTIDAAERAAMLLANLAQSRASVLAKMAPQLDAEVAMAIEAERRQAPVVSAPLIDSPYKLVN